MINRLQGKVAVITGAGRGIGAAIARLFAYHGAVVVVSDILQDDASRTAYEISDNGGVTEFVQLDVSRADDWKSAIRVILSKFGTIDILINNAGIYSAVPIEKTSLDQWETIMDVNSKGVFLGIQSVLPTFISAGGGNIVNISSTTGLVGREIGGAYGASKAAIRLLTKYVAIQHAKHGVRVNSVHPGAVDTEMISDNLNSPGGRTNSIARVPMRRLGTVTDVANGVLFLASDDSSYITGAELVIDGGMTAQ